MMKRKYLFIALLVLMTSTMLHAANYKIDGIYYNLSGSTATVVGRSSDPYSGSVNIPESVTYSNKTYSVKKIESNAFNDCTNLTSVTIPKSVREIGQGCFAGCI